MSAKNIVQRLYNFPKPTPWDKGVGAELPEVYKKFWTEWKLTEPTAVHYIKQEGKYIRNEETEEVLPVQNVPIPLRYPKEFHEGIWGGEGIIQGYRKRKPGKYIPRDPHFWVPRLQRSVLYSEVLDTYMNVVITNRTIDLIHEHYGFDHYLLKTPAYDLKSELALRIKRQILIALADKTLYPNDKLKQEEIYNKFKQYLSSYTREEIEWYGLSYPEACKKWIKEKRATEIIEPLKVKYRSELIEKLKENKLQDVEDTEAPLLKSESSWISKINPFLKST